jgi:hypothetical protein
MSLTLEFSSMYCEKTIAPLVSVRQEAWGRAAVIWNSTLISVAEMWLMLVGQPCTLRKVCDRARLWRSAPQLCLRLHRSKGRCHKLESVRRTNYYLKAAPGARAAFPFRYQHAGTRNNLHFLFESSDLDIPLAAHSDRSPLHVHS